MRPTSPGNRTASVDHQPRHDPGRHRRPARPPQPRHDPGLRQRKSPTARFADEYFAVTEKVEAPYGQRVPLPADAIGARMARLRREHRRLLGNGYCTRPPELDCAFEAICGTCTFFHTSIEFRPTLQRQREHVARHDQTHRVDLFDRLITHLGAKDLGQLDTDYLHNAAMGALVGFVCSRAGAGPVHRELREPGVKLSTSGRPRRGLRTPRSAWSRARALERLSGPVWIRCPRAPRRPLTRSTSALSWPGARLSARHRNGGGALRSPVRLGWRSCRSVIWRSLDARICR
jgi:hypothetical protein